MSEKIPIATVRSSQMHRYAPVIAAVYACVLLFASGAWAAESFGGSSGSPLGKAPLCPCSKIDSPTPTKITLPYSGGRWELWCKGGKKNGTSTIWNKEGVKIAEEEFAEGQRHGTSRRWTPDGKLAEESVYRNDICRVTKRWYASGRWSYYGEWDDERQIIYQVAWRDDGDKEYEVGLPPASIPADAPRSQCDSISPDIVRRADEYIISKVGKEYFKDNYTFVRTKSQFHAAKTKDGRGEYFLYYQYKPLLRINSNELLFVRMFDGDSAPRDYVGSVIDGRVVEPAVSKEQARRTAANEFAILPSDHVQVRLVVPSQMYIDLKNWTWVVYVDRPSATSPEIGTITRVFVDAVTGKVLSKSTTGWAH
jgi:hypothetical protein